MVHAPVQKRPVVGDKQEAPAAVAEILGKQLPPLLVQVVGGLVQHGPAPLVQKQGGQEHPGLLPSAQGGEGALQHLLIQPQQGQLPDPLPLLCLR